MIIRKLAGHEWPGKDGSEPTAHVGFPDLVACMLAQAYEYMDASPCKVQCVLEICEFRTV